MSRRDSELLHVVIDPDGGPERQGGAAWDSSPCPRPPRRSSADGECNTYAPPSWVSPGTRSRDVPQEVTRAFSRAISAAELDRALSLFASGGCFVTPDATAVTDPEGIRAILVQLIAGRVHLQVTLMSVQSAGGTAICSERWTFTYACAGANPFTWASDSMALLRRSSGAWKLSIAAPWGVANANRHPFAHALAEIERGKT